MPAPDGYAQRVASMMPDLLAELADLVPIPSVSLPAGPPEPHRAKA